MAIERSAAAEAARAPATPTAAPLPAPTTVITLEHGEHFDSTLYRFEKGCYLQFCPGPSLLGRKVFLYTNYVLTDDEQEDQSEFIRNQYYGLEWRAEGEEGEKGESLGAGPLVTDTDLYCKIKLARAGSFHFYFVYDNAESKIGPQGSGWFHVAPTLRAGPGGAARIPLDGVAMQTVLAKSLGPLPRWENTLRVAKETGYNMIHFTPIQELGGSNSSYSIANQLKLNPRFGQDTGREVTFADVENIVAKIKNDWNMLSICDVVLNHTANETSWVAEHPEATYNCGSCAYLRPAALLDAALAALTARVARALHAPPVPPRVTQHAHVEAIKHILETQVVPELRLHEMYMCNVSELVQEFYFLARNKVPAVKAPAEAERPVLKLVEDPQYRRLRATIDLDAALQLYNVYRSECYDEESRLKKCCEELKLNLEQLNEAAAEQVRGHLRAAVDNVVAGMRYYRLQSDGPKIEEVSAKNPLVPRYFTWACDVESCSSAEVEAALYGGEGGTVMAHNGWVMGADPLTDFAARPAAAVYLRRDLLAWGDSIKLRYGDKPEDSPFLWAHMREYVELTAEVFDGLRLDNCHSTPLHVAEYMLDCARNVKPDLYVVAELFTNSDQVDNIFVNRLGITSLIREAQSAWDSHEQGRLLHRFGGRGAGAFMWGGPRPAVPHVARAALYDLTHDNPSPIDKRSVWDLLPSSALVSMACCATGSTRGYDELVPHHVHVVDESRLYCEWSDGAEPAEGGVGSACGILAAKRALNELHLQLAQGGYDEVYVDQMDADVVAVTRHEPRSRRSVIAVAFTAFRPPAAAARRAPPPLRFEGQLEQILIETGLRIKDHTAGPFSKHPRYITGLAQYDAPVRRDVPLAQSDVFAAERTEGQTTILEFKPLSPGTVVVIRVAPRPAAASAVAALHRHMELAAGGDPYGLQPALAELDLVDFNVLLYRCDAEERDAGGGGVYDVPGHGPLVYAGLQGVISLLSEITPNDDLGHPLCDNLRAGDWLMDYTCARLERDPRLAAVAAKYREAFRPISALPRFLVPAYFAAAAGALHGALVAAALRRVRAPPGTLRAALALTSVQLTGHVPSATLPAPLPASPTAPAPRGPRPGSLSAGLPHFVVGYTRCWGRDTFIALRGMFLLTGRYEDARLHILSYGACLRHGLIPNLLDCGKNARYNCRDAVWWWLYCVQQYCKEAPDGLSLLSEPVCRLQAREEGAPAAAPLHELLQDALDTHFQGLVFRERNAGRTIDAHMTDKGFNVQIGIDPETGFPFGGNDSNCGTWMDKMGSSDKAGNRGQPATPRDGSAIELVALAYSTARWLAELHRAGRYPTPGLVRRHRDGTLTSWTFAQWADRIRASFERHFWVPPTPAAPDARPDLVHRRAIYKDTHGASRPWADYQLRCNFPVAMALAPDLFDPRHAWQALDQVEKLLLGPLGVKTLDPADWAYRPDYDNSNDSDDPSVAHGFNYHQGPEWGWPLGFYVRARLAFAHPCGKHARAVAAGYRALGPSAAELRASPWRGLPELTNAGGAYCRDSCRSQAWTAASALEALHELRAARRARPLAD